MFSDLKSVPHLAEFCRSERHFENTEICNPAWPQHCTSYLHHRLIVMCRTSLLELTVYQCIWLFVIQHLRTTQVWQVVSVLLWTHPIRSYMHNKMPGKSHERLETVEWQIYKSWLTLVKINNIHCDRCLMTQFESYDPNQLKPLGQPRLQPKPKNKQ